jgi:hypothetical protein
MIAVEEGAAQQQRPRAIIPVDQTTAHLTSQR